MITFQFIRWMNLLSTGNVMTEVRLDKSRTTLIIGSNGAGKSTILDALKLGLYNKPFRKVTKGLLINSVTNKNLLIEIGFTKGSDEYLVRRGAKPNLFEIHKNGELIDQNADGRDYQEHLENILGMNEKAFTQIVILGAASFVPFMQLSVPVRREVIEDFMDIQIFSDMNDLLRGRVSGNKDSLVKTRQAKEVVEAKLKQAEGIAKELEASNNEIIERKQKKLDGIIEAAMHLLESKQVVEQNCADIEIDTSFELQLNEYRKELDQRLQSHRFDNKTREKEVSFIKTHDDCPTCKQHIDPEFKTNRVVEHQQHIDSNNQTIQEILDELSKVDAALNDIFDTQKLIRKYQNEIDAFERDIVSYKREAERLTAEIEELSKPKDHINLEPLKQELDDKLVAYNASVTESKVLGAAQSLLKDDGIKSVIIKKYIPVVNNLINQYLTQMDFFVDFHLNEAFEETIRSRFRDEFMYESFSEGEKMRIDLAILFAWREVAKLRNSAATNLLIFDEVLDSSLDPAGVEEFIRIIQTLTSNENVFVISHRGDTIGDKFDDVLKFIREHGFSKLEAQ